ncbi:DNA internalization-related competence protein ComEC/Rec2 [Ramlibacter sp. HM2]|uniref:DNA internalization-related competence protein ComEC/Rec2 n=1 Tax=Ramlibacter pallidus TaxID=2780087 RepID=A0ABR9S5K9_9BURK|nr:DNA internalization-related competence protein ComEC/Rec2 [Ramlibacter pallidus]MBE7368798.1 DNA internalization-related competence protein ComEC/Rec2 [Ramlibacter pallidus]
MLGLVLGAAAQLQQPQLWAAAAYAAAAAAGAALLWAALRLGRPQLRAIAVACACALLSAGTTGWRAAAYVAQGLDPQLEGRDLVLTGVVSGLPQRNEAGVRFRFDVDAARDGVEELRLPRRVLLGWYGGADPGPREAPVPAVSPGERWQWTVRLKAPHGHVNPHGFDYELWLWEQGLQATGYVRAGPRDPPPQRLASTWRHPVERARAQVRDAIFARVADPRLAGVLAALVVGDQRAIDRADWDVFRATGVAHLMSISGLHVTMFAWAAAAVAGLLWRRSTRLCLAWPAQHAALVAGIGCAAGYALFSGWGVPAQRTVWMLAAVGVLRLGARDWPWPWVWLLACATVVVADPWALTQAGFWLSFVAVGVLFASGRPAAPEPGVHAGGRAVAALRALVREQWIVTVALTPLSLLLFGQVSLVGLPANLLAIPWVTLVVTPLGLAGVPFPPAWDAAAAAIALLAAWLQALAEVPQATWSAPAPPLWAAAAGLAGGLLLAMRLPATLRLFGLPLLLPVLLWQAPRPPPGEFALLAADVGQGNAVLVRTASHTLVYDAGPGYSRDTDAGQRVLVPLLRAGGDPVRLLVLSHGDSDHTGGAAAVLRMQPRAGLLSSLDAGHPLSLSRPGERCAAGQRWTWDGVRFEVLHPPADAAPARKPNAASCVLRVGNGRAHVLLAGDIEKAQEAWLAAAGADLSADLLLVPHHGSRTSSTGALLDAVRPTLAVVQAGYRNRFGHPAAEVVQRYRERGIAVAASPRCGAAAWDSRAPRRLQCERARQPRYWRHTLPAGPGDPP